MYSSFPLCLIYIRRGYPDHLHCSLYTVTSILSVIAFAFLKDINNSNDFIVKEMVSYYFDKTRL